MKPNMAVLLGVVTTAALAGPALLWPREAQGHCDTLDGPVVLEARSAPEKGDVTPVLKWVKAEQEAEVRAAFHKARAVRGKGAEAQDLADTFFFETLVRLHRAGEGAPYTGLKPAGTDLGPVVAAADKALETGSADALVKLITERAEKGLRERFALALERKKHAGHSVQTGREYVDAYVDFVHYAERLHDAAAPTAGLHGEHRQAVEPAPAPEH